MSIALGVLALGVFTLEKLTCVAWGVLTLSSTYFKVYLL